MIRWLAPGPYRVGFTTRDGGCSSGVFESLNLGGRGDDPALVRENRRIACEALGVDSERLVCNRQRHTATVIRAHPGTGGEVGDALWTDDPGLPLLALSADCVPIAIVATGGRPALAVVHAGWRGLAAGVVARAVASLGEGETAAVVGPAIGPCCYEVGPEVSQQFAPDLTRGRRLDLWEASARALADAGVGQVERVGLCTRCDPERFFSHRASAGGGHGVQGVIGAIER